MLFLWQCGTIGESGVILPPALNPTSERFERHGLFLIEDGQNIFLWIGRDAVPQLIVDVFDLPSYAELRGGKVSSTHNADEQPADLSPGSTHCRRLSMRWTTRSRSA